MPEQQLVRDLHQGLTGLGLDPSACPCEAYLEYIDLLAKWNRAYSLTGVRGKRRMIPVHILDSLAVLPYIRGNRCLDVGAGAGLPGFILALAQPERQWSLLDSNAKKVRFLRQLVFEMQIDNVEIIHCRVEKFLSSVAYSSIISRAFGSLSSYYRAIEHLAQPGTRILALKGRLSAEELQQAVVWRQPIAVEELRVPGVDAYRSLALLDR